MDRNIIIDKVAAGLRRMETPPDCFVFLSSGDEDEDEKWTWDEETILGIPVLHCSFQFLKFRPYSDTDCPFLPVYKMKGHKDETYHFARGYYEG